MNEATKNRIARRMVRQWRAWAQTPGDQAEAFAADICADLAQMEHDGFFDETSNEQPDYGIDLLLFEDTPGFGYLIFPAPDGVRYVGVNVTGEGFFFPLTGFVIYKTEEEAREYQALLVAQHKKEQANIIVPKIRPIAVEKLPKDIQKIITREARRRRDD